jgi:hypothetical protein
VTIDSDVDGITRWHDADDDNNGVVETIEPGLDTEPLNSDTDDMVSQMDSKSITIQIRRIAVRRFTDLNTMQTDTGGDGLGDVDGILAGFDPLDAASRPADGDINLDGKVDVVDVLQARRALLEGSEVLDAVQQLRADIAPLSGGMVPARMACSTRVMCC